MVLFENTVPPPIPLVDGADPITTGTPTDAAFYNALKASLNVQLHDTSDPTKHPKDAIAELKAAREAYGSLLLKLNAMSAAFTGVGPSVIRNGFVLGNLLANDSFLMWSRGDAAAPNHWALSGAGAAVARTGVGQADTQVLTSQDHFAAKLTYGSAAAVLAQNALEATLAVPYFASNRLAPVDALDVTAPGYGNNDTNTNAYLIYHVWCDGTNRARLGLAYGTETVYSPYHPGNSQWRTLVAGPVDFAGTDLIQAQLRVEAAGAAYFQCGSLIFSALDLPPMYIPSLVRYRTHTFYANNPATGVLTYFTFARPAFVLGAQMQCLTAGTVTAPTCDLLTPIGGVYSSLFATLPTIATTQLVGAAQVCNPAAANYRRRTVIPALVASATQVDNTSLRLDYVDDGGGTLRDLMVTIHYLEYLRPFDQFRAMADLGEA